MTRGQTANDRRWHDRREEWSAFAAASRRLAAKIRRRFARIALECSTEPTEVFMAASMVLSGITLIWFAAVPPLPFPVFCGHWLGITGTVGLFGVATGHSGARMAFAFSGIIVRSWMAVIYISMDWHNPSWIPLLIASLACAWIMARLRCSEKGADE
jgi:hypothetical protein